MTEQTFRKIAFVGPTLPLGLQPAGGVEFHDPVQHGTLFALSLERGDMVLVIDGIYRNFAPLRHKEILAHIAGGVRVFGAASYGALRAAELHEHGMIPLGRVAHAYCNGTIRDDGEVAVLHAPYKGHSRLTVPLVSIRFALKDWQEQGRITGAKAEAVLDRLAGVNFASRTHSVVRDALERDDLINEVDAFMAAIAHGADVKAIDAEAAVRYLGALDPNEGTEMPRPRWQTTTARIAEFEARKVHPDFPLTHRQFAVAAQLLDPVYPEHHRRYAMAVAIRTCSDGSTADNIMAEDALRRIGYDAPLSGAAFFAAATRATENWSAADRVLTRTFRLAPGTQPLYALPQGLPGPDKGVALAACLSRHLAQCGDWQVRARDWRSALMSRFACQSPGEFELCFMERGLLNMQTGLRMAADFKTSLLADGQAADMLACHV
ncbi:TfuA-like protein [Rhizobium ruizarguesonis]